MKALQAQFFNLNLKKIIYSTEMDNKEAAVIVSGKTVILHHGD